MGGGQMPSFSLFSLSPADAADAIMLLYGVPDPRHQCRFDRRGASSPPLVRFDKQLIGAAAPAAAHLLQPRKTLPLVGEHVAGRTTHRRALKSQTATTTQKSKGQQRDSKQRTREEQITGQIPRKGGGRRAPFSKEAYVHIRWNVSLRVHIGRLDTRDSALSGQPRAGACNFVRLTPVHHGGLACLPDPECRSVLGVGL